MLQNRQATFSFNIAKLILYANSQGYQVTFGEAYRTQYQQDYNIIHGLSKVSDSLHMERLAIDLNIFKDGKLLSSVDDIRPLGKYWELMGKDNVWGGSWLKFPDADHFQMNI